VSRTFWKIYLHILFLVYYSVFVMGVFLLIICIMYDFCRYSVYYYCGCIPSHILFTYFIIFIVLLFCFIIMGVFLLLFFFHITLSSTELANMKIRFPIIIAFP
jgi:hypothetical protein